MPNRNAHVGIVRQWCQSLGILSAVSASRNEAEMKLAAFVPLLVREFPDAAFTQDSLSHVARRAVKGFPTYGELVEWLAEWWRDNRPPSSLPALPPPDLPPPRPPPTPEELAYIRVRVAEAVAALHSSASDPRDDRPGFGPRHLSPGQLDALNPLPNGRKRAAAP